MSIIFDRCSIREWEDKPVEDEKITEILRAGFQAPSARNQQPWEFWVVTNKEKIEELSQTTPYTKCIAGAPVVLALGYYKEGLSAQEFAPNDMAIAQENIWLATTEVGLGGVWCGIYPNEERMKKLHDAVGMPDEIEAFSIFALGYPAQNRQQQDRFKPERIHYIK